MIDDRRSEKECPGRAPPSTTLSAGAPKYRPAGPQQTHADWHHLRLSTLLAHFFKPKLLRFAVQRRIDVGPLPVNRIPESGKKLAVFLLMP
jgi:hypothetical protein